MNKTNLISEIRKDFVENIISTLTGKGLPNEMRYNPAKTFVCAVLSPQKEKLLESQIDENMEDELKNTLSATQRSTKSISHSSAGFSFLAKDELVFDVYCSFCVYQKTSEERNELGQFVGYVWSKKRFDICIPDRTLNDFSQSICEGRAEIRADIKHNENGKILTLSILNTSSFSVPKERFDAENSLFEVELKCVVKSGKVISYPRKNPEFLSQEEKKIELIYQDEKIYAIGHGTCANWTLANNEVKEIFTDFIPVYEVAQTTSDTSKSKVLELDILSSDNKSLIIELLSDFTKEYEGWIKEQIVRSKNEIDIEIAQKIIAEQEKALLRMNIGLEVLKSDVCAFEAFKIMNEAMLKQWSQGNDKPLDSYKWRPFQLAFILMTLESVINENSEYRDTLDLIWFATGGGKTEAYLGVMAFLFIYGRLKEPGTSGGTRAIMRYTLRLLTSQQFLRANKVIFALELLREANPKKLGLEPFSSGLWVGGGVSPNTLKQAQEAKQKKNFKKFILSQCPWCGSNFETKNYFIEQDEDLNAIAMRFKCFNEECEFHNKILPINIVDEMLYQNPPTLLIATVDKFANLARDHRCSVFFGLGENKPPELIIQDELHLISSDIGSIYGLYEAGFETAIIAKGRIPKYIASSATIKNASLQGRLLFGKDDVAIFPPSGLRHNDSYFAKVVSLDERPGRLYIGYLAPGKAQRECLTPLATAILLAKEYIGIKYPDFADAWWTQVVYHGSLKGVQNSKNLYERDIKEKYSKAIVEQIKTRIRNEHQTELNFDDIRKFDELCADKNISLEARTSLKASAPYLKTLNIKEITSRQNEEVAKNFKELELSCENEKVIDVALSTNMMSVGVDVVRLALMIIQGQLLTTAEYIQASSRVGRGDVPGIVFVDYYRSQSRSISHYENFISYHKSFYRFVEPTSTTPYTFQARKKALHAALVIAIRHSGIGLETNDGAGKLNLNNEKTKALLNILKSRILRACDKRSVGFVLEHLDRLLFEWEQKISSYAKNYSSLVYMKPETKTEKPLMCEFFDNVEAWKTLSSMRNVEKTVLIQDFLKKEKYTPIGFSHVMSYQGIGSIVYDKNDISGVIMDTNEWKIDEKEITTTIPYTKRVADMLGVKELKTPPAGQLDDNGKLSGCYLKTKIFPKYFICPQCDRIYYYNYTNELFCPHCQNENLKQIRWCKISKEGFMCDVNWLYLAHEGRDSSSCQTNPQDISNIALREERGKKIVVCLKCGSRSAPFEGRIFGNHIMSKRQPWLDNDNKTPQEMRIASEAKIVKISDPLVYIPHTQSAIVIPPESRLSGSGLVDKLYNNSNAYREYKNAKTELSINSVLSKIAREFGVEKEAVKNAFDQIDNGYAQNLEFHSAGSMMNDEYNAFLTHIYDLGEEEDFITEHKTQDLQKINPKSQELQAVKNIINELIAVKRLREILVFKGFNRFESNEEFVVAPDLYNKNEWLPATELFGEGIFFTLNEDILKAWSKQESIAQRISKLKEKYENSEKKFASNILPTAQFILLHTLGHLLIKELENICGYPASSLKERIYSSHEMCGVLIYTTSADVSGTLGGLVECAEPLRFLELLSTAINHAEVCTLDPFCFEHESSLNRSACHACSLIPEPSCVCANEFLDRSFIKGGKDFKGILEFKG